MRRTKHIIPTASEHFKACEKTNSMKGDKINNRRRIHCQRNGNRRKISKPKSLKHLKTYKKEEIAFIKSNYKINPGRYKVRTDWL